MVEEFKIENPKIKWEECLRFISHNLTPDQYKTWFATIVYESYSQKDKVLLLRLPSPFAYEYIEEHYIDLLRKALHRSFGENVQLKYRVVYDKTNNIAPVMQAEPTANIDKPTKLTGINKTPTLIDSVTPLDSQLNPHLTFENFIEGDSNRMPRSIGMSIAEHPFKNMFNPFFIFGPSGCGKTHLINAIGAKIKERYYDKRVLYISARLFQVQFTDAVRQNKINEFIRFYQTIDVLIVDDIQEWMNATKTQDTFFHIFNHLFRNGKRIILASDRPPVDLEGMNERLLTRFKCGLIAELEKPNVQLCIDILNSKIRRDGLHIAQNVVEYIAQNANGSVRDLEGVVNSLMAYSVVYNSNIDLRLAERVIKRAVKSDNHPLTVDEIIEGVCKHFNVSQQNIATKSRKHDLVVARQVSMYLAQKYTKMPASRIGKLVGGRDHSTVIHSCNTIEKKISDDKEFEKEIKKIEKSFKLKNN